MFDFPKHLRLMATSWWDNVVCRRRRSMVTVKVHFAVNMFVLVSPQMAKVTQWTVGYSDMDFLSACGLLIHFKPPPTFPEAGVHLQADQGRSCVHCCYSSITGRHILAYFLFFLANSVIALVHVLPIKHVNGALLNKSHRPTCACTIKWVSCLVVCWMRSPYRSTHVYHVFFFFYCRLEIMKIFLLLLCCQNYLKR